MRNQIITEIFLVRHAESKLNPERIYSSNPENDKGLSARGKKQAILVEKRFQKESIKFDVFYSSPLPRCVETSKILSRYLKNKIILNNNLREPYMGKYELMSESEIEKKFPKIAHQWFYGDVTNLRFGEKIKDANKRILIELNKIINTHKEKRILIVTHQAPIKFIVCSLFGGLKYFNNFQLSNASVTLLNYKRKRFKLQYLNDISHLNHLK